MSSERLPDGPDLDEILRLIRDAFPGAVVAQGGPRLEFLPQSVGL